MRFISVALRAASSAIRDTAMEVEDVTMYLSAYLLERYPEQLVNRYQIDTLPTTEFEFLELLGARRGALRAGGQLNLVKVSSILINEFRADLLGEITLEEPAMIVAEEKIVAQKYEEKSEKERLRKQKKARQPQKNSVLEIALSRSIRSSTWRDNVYNLPSTRP